MTYFDDGELEGIIELQKWLGAIGVANVFSLSCTQAATSSWTLAVILLVLLILVSSVYIEIIYRHSCPEVVQT